MLTLDSIPQVIWDETLIPPRVHTPAAYPRLAPKELSRAVTRKDMSDFFVTCTCQIQHDMALADR